jgi:hypothetical protein
MASTALVVASPADPAHGGGPFLTSPGLTRTGRKSGPPERLGMVAMGTTWGDEDDDEDVADDEDEESADEQAPSATGPARKRGRGCGHEHNNINKNTGKKTAYCAPCLTTRFHSNFAVATNRLPELDAQFVVDNAAAMQKRLTDSIQRAADPRSLSAATAAAGWVAAVGWAAADWAAGWAAAERAAAAVAAPSSTDSPPSLVCLPSWQSDSWAQHTRPS